MRPTVRHPRRRAGILHVLALAAALLPPSARAQARSRGAERELFRLEDSWATALVTRDSTIFLRLLAPDYVYSDERGTFTKRQVIDETFGGTDRVTFAANEGMRAHLHGDAAVVTGILATRGRGKDGPFQHRYRYTDTWVRRGGRWIMIASQDYDVPRR